MKLASEGMVAMTVAVVLLGASTASAWYPYSEKYTKWQEDRPFIMGGWHGGFIKDRIPERIARFQAAGLNQIVLDREHALPLLAPARSAGLQWTWCWRGKSIPEEVTHLPEGAIIVVDEPTTYKLPEVERPAVYAKVRDRIVWVRKNMPDTLAYANLSIAKIDLETYITTCKPDVFSFDYYPLRRDGSDASSYLYCLNWARQTARKHHLPYWMILQAHGRRDERPQYARRIPGPADMRFLAFSLLAHGGTGMQFFLYYTKVSEPMIGRRHRLDEPYEDNYLTAPYFAVRDMAPEIQVLGRALLNLRTKDPLGYEGVLPDRCSAFEGHGALKSVANLDNAEESVLVAFFDDKSGEEYFMIVNMVHGLNLSKMDGARTVRTVFDKSVEKIERLNRLTGFVETLRTKDEGDGRVLDIQIEGGTGDLFKWATDKPWDLREE